MKYIWFLLLLTVWSGTESGDSHSDGVDEASEESEGEVQVVGGVSGDHVLDGGVAEEGDSGREINMCRRALVDTVLDDLEPIIGVRLPEK